MKKKLDLLSLNLKKFEKVNSPEVKQLRGGGVPVVAPGTCTSGAGSCTNQQTLHRTLADG